MPKPFYGWIIVGGLFVINFGIQSAGLFNLGLFVIPMCNELGISRSLFGWLVTIRSLSGGVSAFFIGRIVDKFGSRVLIPITALITACCMVGIGLAHHISVLIALFFLTGLASIAAGGGGVLTMVPVAKWFISRRGLAMGISILGTGFGAVSFIPLSQFLIAHFGWRITWFILSAAFSLLIIPVALLVIRRQPEDMDLLPDGENSGEATQTGTPTKGDLEANWTMREALGTRSFWLLNIAIMVWGVVNGSAVHRIAFWTGMGFNPQLVSFVFTIDAGCFTVTVLAAGILFDRFPPRLVYSGAYLSVICAMWLMITASSEYHMIASVICYGAAMGTHMVAQSYIWAKYYGRTFLGAIRGVTLPIYLVAMAAGAPFTGFVYDRTGSYHNAWQIIILIFIIGFLCLLAAKPPLKKA